MRQELGLMAKALKSSKELWAEERDMLTHQVDRLRQSLKRTSNELTEAEVQMRLHLLDFPSNPH